MFIYQFNIYKGTFQKTFYIKILQLNKIKTPSIEFKSNQKQSIIYNGFSSMSVLLTFLHNKVLWPPWWSFHWL